MGPSFLSRMLLQGPGGGVCGEPHRVRADRTSGIETQAKLSSRSVCVCVCVCARALLPMNHELAIQITV